MLLQELEELLDQDLPQDQVERLWEHYYYSNRRYNDSKIRLHRDHSPIHPKVCINTQKDYEYYLGTFLYLREQINRGVTPKYLVTFHYQHPTEKIKSIKETDRPYGFGDRYGFRNYSNLWNEVSSYNYWASKRNDENQVVRDAGQIRNSVLKLFYGIKRLNQTWKNKYPNILFFHEKGKTKLQYHTHLLLPETRYYNCVADLIDIFNTTIRTTRKCMSKWKSIDVKQIANRDKYSVVGYLNKETTSKHISFDPFNSIPVLN